jgi:Helicase associated domain
VNLRTRVRATPFGISNPSRRLHFRVHTGEGNGLYRAPSGFRTPDPLIKRGRLWSLPTVSGCVPYSVGRQCFAYLITSYRSRSIPVDCESFAPHKRHLALLAMANLLPHRADLAENATVLRAVRGDRDESDGYRLGRWTAQQRSLCNKGKLRPDRWKRLKELKGWDWNPPRSASARRK